MRFGLGKMVSRSQPFFRFISLPLFENPAIGCGACSYDMLVQQELRGPYTRFLHVPDWRMTSSSPRFRAR